MSASSPNYAWGGRGTTLSTDVHELAPHGEETVLFAEGFLIVADDACGVFLQILHVVI